jgi:hypothetical protein
MAKAKKANKKAARPAKKVPARKVARKADKPRTKPAPKKQVKRPAKKKTPAVPAAAPLAPPAPPVAPIPKPASPAVTAVTALPAAVAAAAPDQDALAPARKKGVRKATIASGVADPNPARRLGRSRIPVDAPLDVVFQNDTQAREAFSFLGIHSIRELEAFTADDLVLRLTGPAKLTVGRIRKILAMNNRCLTGDEDFAVEFQELHTKVRPE